MVTSPRPPAQRRPLLVPPAGTAPVRHSQLTVETHIVAFAPLGPASLVPGTSVRPPTYSTRLYTHPRGSPPLQVHRAVARSPVGDGSPRPLPRDRHGPEPSPPFERAGRKSRCDLHGRARAGCGRKTAVLIVCRGGPGRLYRLLRGDGPSPPTIRSHGEARDRGTDRGARRGTGQAGGPVDQASGGGVARARRTRRRRTTLTQSLTLRNRKTGSGCSRRSGSASAGRTRVSPTACRGSRGGRGGEGGRRVAVRSVEPTRSCRVCDSVCRGEGGHDGSRSASTSRMTTR